MSRIFLSHSSVDELEAIALQQWMAANGWEDVFLDIDPQRGLAAGERWQEALRRAADRCEAVVFIVTPAWAKSKWCLAEFLLAKSLNKRIFGAILKPVEISELPTELTAEWQLSHLVGDGPTTALAFTHRGQAQRGLQPRWPPHRLRQFGQDAAAMGCEDRRGYWRAAARA